MSDNKRLKNYDDLPLVLDVADIRRTNAGKHRRNGAGKRLWGRTATGSILTYLIYGKRVKFVANTGHCRGAYKYR